MTQPVGKLYSPASPTQVHGSISPDIGQYRKTPLWPWALATLPLLAYFLWAGASADPRDAMLWSWIGEPH